MWSVWQQHDDMKTVSFDDEAYELLKGAKLPGESFSDVVKRTIGPRRGDGLEATFGAWKGRGEERMAELRRRRVEAFGTTLDRPRRSP